MRKNKNLWTALKYQIAFLRCLELIQTVINGLQEGGQGPVLRASKLYQHPIVSSDPLLTIKADLKEYNKLARRAHNMKNWKANEDAERWHTRMKNPSVRAAAAAPLVLLHERARHWKARKRMPRNADSFALINSIHM